MIDTDLLGTCVNELHSILLVDGLPPFQRWTRRALTPVLQAKAAHVPIEESDLSQLVGLLLKHWPVLSQGDTREFGGEVKGRLHAIRSVRNHLAHFTPATYPSTHSFLEDLAVTRSFLEMIGADSALLARSEALIEAFVQGQRPPRSAGQPAGSQVLTQDDVRRIVRETLERLPPATASDRHDPLAPVASETPSDTKVKPARRSAPPAVSPPASGPEAGVTDTPSLTRTRQDDRPVRSYRSPSMSPIQVGAELELFEYLSVPRDQLRSVQDTVESRQIPPGLQWRMEHWPAASRNAHDQPTMRALIVAEKVLRRGRVTRLSRDLEDRLSVGKRADEPAAQVDPRTAFETAPESPAERLFLRMFAKYWRGDWYRWISAQVDLASLLLGKNAQGLEGRVDFLVTHPSLDRPTVIEIDGPQHESSVADAERDKALRSAGFEVLRFKSGEVVAGTNREMKRFLASRPPETVGPQGGVALRVRRAGQIQAVILHALIQGDIPALGNEAFAVSSDLVDAGVFSLDDLQATVDDLVSLVQRCGELYGASLLAGGIRASRGGGHRLCFLTTPEATDTGAIFVSDIHLPFHLTLPPRTCTPALPVHFDKPALDWFLQRIYQKQSLRDEQFTAISRAFRGLDSVVLLPTGAGKSIAFQLAGMLLPGRTVVVAPLVALIRDQAAVLSSHGIDRVLAITSDSLQQTGRGEVYQQLQRADALFIYVSPERYQIREFRDALRGMTLSMPVSLIVIDEAHCVSEWGHDFRPAYLRIGRVAREVSGRGPWTPPLMALTGTASRMVLKDLQRELEIPDYDALITPASFDRKELRFRVETCDSSQKTAQLEALLSTAIPAAFGQSRSGLHAPRGDQSYCGLIFCPFVNGEFGVVGVRDALARLGLPTEIYAGKAPRDWRGNQGSWNDYKRRVERSFKRNETVRLACTKAFGMGIDKPNVRYAIHLGVPASIESFYQEAGRAGRDGKDALCIVLLSEFDPRRNAWLLSPDNDVEAVAARLENVGYELRRV